MSARPAQLAPPGGDVIGWLDAVAEPVLVLEEADGGLRLVHVNEALCKAVSMDRATLMAHGLGAWLGDEPLGRLQRAAASALKSGRARCREVDPSGAMAELRRVRGRDGDYCVATLRLPAGTSEAPLSRDELKRRTDLLTTAMDLESMVAWSWDMDSDELCLEYRAAAATFVPLQEPVLPAFFEQVHPDDRARVNEVMREALGDDHIHQAEFRFLTPQGRVNWISSAMKRFLDDDGRPAGLVGASRDITRRKDVYQELADSEHRLRTVLDNEPECVKIVDWDFRLSMLNPAGVAMIGANDAGEVLGTDARDLVSPTHRAAYEEYHRRVCEGATVTLEFDLVGLTGQRRSVESHAAPLRDAEGKVIGHLAVMRDITERRRLSRALIESADLEQERIGRDLHDGLGQDLTGIALMLKGLQGQLDRPAAAVRADLEDIAAMVNRALKGTRRLVRGLSPVALEQGGLVQALRELTLRARESGALRGRLTLPSVVAGGLERSVAIQLYRIAQEALSNALRHAQATQLDVSLRDTRGGLRLRVADNGRGLPAGASKRSGLGLRTMQYRAALIGATLDVRSRTAGGTEVVVTLPVARAEGKPG